MRRALLASATVLLLCCNSGPKDTCTPYAHSVAASGMPTESCGAAGGTCVELPIYDAGLEAAAYEYCLIDCTNGGTSACNTNGASGLVCIPSPLGGTQSYCVYPCGGTNGNVCPSPLSCAEAGVCL